MRQLPCCFDASEFQSLPRLEMETKTNGIEEDEASKLEQGFSASDRPVACDRVIKNPSFSASAFVHAIAPKLFAEVIGTYFVIFAGCGSVAVNKIYGSITFPGICVTWGLIVMVMIYSVGHISGAHFNPAVTISFAVFRRFPVREVPFYIVGQIVGSILASETLSCLFDITPKSYFGTVPVGSSGQSFVLEIIISFLLMFVIFGVSAPIDDRPVRELAGLAVGMTITLNVFVAGPISGASMNPARSIGPAVIRHAYNGLWVYILGPIIGTITGGLAHDLISRADDSLSFISCFGRKGF